MRDVCLMRSCMFGLQICRRKVRRIQVEITIVSIRLDASDGRVANRITPKKKKIIVRWISKNIEQKENGPVDLQEPRLSGGSRR